MLNLVGQLYFPEQHISSPVYSTVPLLSFASTLRCHVPIWIAGMLISAVESDNKV